MKRDKQGKFAKLYNGFKGYFKFGRNFSCRDQIYKLGKLFTKKTRKKDLETCSDTGYHFCPEAWNVWEYYAPGPFSVYSEVAAGPSVIDDDGKGITSRLKVGSKLYSAYEYAGKFFPQRAYTSETCPEVIKDRGFCYLRESVAIGKACGQCLEGPGVAIVAYPYAMAKGSHAYALSPQSFAQGRDIAVAVEGAAEAPLAIGRTHVKSPVKNGVAIGIASGDFYQVNGSVLSGGLGSHLVFIVWHGSIKRSVVRDVKVFKVDGKEVKANVPYSYDEVQDKLVPVNN